MLDLCCFVVLWSEEKMVVSRSLIRAGHASVACCCGLSLVDFFGCIVLYDSSELSRLAQSEECPIREPLTHPKNGQTSTVLTNTTKLYKPNISRARIPEILVLGAVRI